MVVQNAMGGEATSLVPKGARCGRVFPGCTVVPRRFGSARLRICTRAKFELMEYLHPDYYAITHARAYVEKVARAKRRCWNRSYGGQRAGCHTISSGRATGAQDTLFRYGEAICSRTTRATGQWFVSSRLNRTGKSFTCAKVASELAARQPPVHVVVLSLDGLFG